MQQKNKVMKLVMCEEIYWEFVRKLRNDERVQNGFISKTIITEEMQQSYMMRHQDNYRIALIKDEPVGYVGVIDNDIRICTHPDFQGQGVGEFLLKSCINIWPGSTAKIKIDNVASLRLFEACGFEKEFFLLKRKNDTI